MLVGIKGSGQIVQNGIYASLASLRSDWETCAPETNGVTIRPMKAIRQWYATVLSQRMCLHALQRSEACPSASLRIPLADVVISDPSSLSLCNRKQLTLESAHEAGRTMEAILAYRLFQLILFVGCTRAVDPPLILIYAFGFDRPKSVKPPPSISSPTNPIKGRSLAVLGRGAAGAGAGAGASAAVSTGGVSTT